MVTQPDSKLHLQQMKGFGSWDCELAIFSGMDFEIGGWGTHSWGLAGMSETGLSHWVKSPLAAALFLSLCYYPNFLSALFYFLKSIIFVHAFFPSGAVTSARMKVSKGATVQTASVRPLPRTHRPLAQMELEKKDIRETGEHLTVIWFPSRKMWTSGPGKHRTPFFGWHPESPRRKPPARRQA